MKDKIALLISTILYTGFLQGIMWRGKWWIRGEFMGGLCAFAIQLSLSWNRHLISNSVAIGICFSLALISLILGLTLIDRAQNYLLSLARSSPKTSRRLEWKFDSINVDKFYGQMIAGIPVFLLPGLSMFGQMFLLCLSFCFSRVFDDPKRWITQDGAKKVSGAVGIMADDSISGIMVAISVSLIYVLSYAHSLLPHSF